MFAKGCFADPIHPRPSPQKTNLSIFYRFAKFFFEQQKRKPGPHARPSIHPAITWSKTGAANKKSPVDIDKLLSLDRATAEHHPGVEQSERAATQNSGHRPTQEGKKEAEAPRFLPK